MKFTTLTAVAVFATAPVQAATTFASVGAVPEVPNGFEYVVTGGSDNIYFSKQVARQGGYAWSQTYVIETNGETTEWTARYDCKGMAWQMSTGKWDQIPADSVGEELLKYACN